MAYIYDLTDTWNAGGTTFNGIKLNVTDSASAVSSKLVTLQTNGTERFSVTKAGVGYFSGNVGIGTSSPAAKLDVVGAVRATGTAATLFNSFSSVGTTTGANYGSLANTGNTFLWGVDGSAGGSVTGSAPYSSWAGSNAAYPFHLLTAGVVRATIDTSGNLGIGVTPSAWAAGFKAAQIGAYPALWSDGATSAYLSNNVYYDGAFKYLNNGYATYYAQTAVNGVQSWNTAPSGTAGNAISFTQAMTLDASGNLLVGTTSASTTSSSGVKVLPAEGGANNPQLSIVTSASTGTTASLAIYSTGASALRFYVDNGGTIYATSTSISAISDQRLKENVRDLDAGLDTILALKPRRFDWKAGKGKDVRDDMGFIAQEVETVLPELLSGWKAGEGEPDDLKSVKAGDLIPVLVKAIQELTARVAQLEGN